VTRNQLKVFRLIIFLAGAGLFIFAFFLNKNHKELAGIDAFIWTSIGLIYLVFSLPFFFTKFNAADFSKKIPSLSMIWTDIFFYIIASIVILLLLFFNVLSSNAAIFIQGVLLFIFILNIYFAYITSFYTRKAAEDDANKGAGSEPEL